MVDLVLEPLDGYSDAQIGAAARDVLRDCRRVLEQSFAVTAIVNDAEGQSIEVPLGYDPGIFRLIGNVSGAGPFRGTVVHRGWKIVQCQLPAWTGSSEAGKVLTAAEIEVKGT